MNIQSYITHLKSLIINSISNYNQTSITKFDSYFRFSKFTASIDSTSDSIKSNITKIKIKNRLEILETKEPPERPSGIKVSSVDELLDKLKNEVGVI